MIIIMGSYKPYIAMLFVQFVYAGMALLSKAAMQKGMNPVVFVTYRQAFASLALAPFAFFLESNKVNPLSYNSLCKIFFISLCGLTLSLNLYCIAIKYTTATLAAATTNTIPAITFVLAVLLRMERIRLKRTNGIAKVVGSVLGVSGALVFAFVKGPAITTSHSPVAENTTTNGGFSSGNWIKGSLIMISANVLWSLWLVLQGPILKEYPSKLRLTTLQCFFSCIQSAFWAVAVERNPSAWKLGWDINLLSVAYCGIVVNGISYWLQVCAIEKKGPVFTAMFTPIALIITAIFSAIFWKETLFWGSVGGAIMLVAGLYFVLWGKNKEDAENVIAVTQVISETKEKITMESITLTHQ